MMKRVNGILRYLVPGAVLLQITACLGPDPQLFFTAAVANSLVANVVATLFNLVVGGLGITTA